MTSIKDLKDARLHAVQQLGLARLIFNVISCVVCPQMVIVILIIAVLNMVFKNDKVKMVYVKDSYYIVYIMLAWNMPILFGVLAARLIVYAIVINSGMVEYLKKKKGEDKTVILEVV